VSERYNCPAHAPSLFNRVLALRSHLHNTTPPSPVVLSNGMCLLHVAAILNDAFASALLAAQAHVAHRLCYGRAGPALYTLYNIQQRIVYSIRGTVNR
jgi:hypothetical protein